MPDERTLVKIAHFYRSVDDLPPAMERISVHPDELPALLARIPIPKLSPLNAFSAEALLSVPVVSDPDVPPNVVRVRRGGVDTDHPIRPTPPLRRARWWRRGGRR